MQNARSLNPGSQDSDKLYRSRNGLIIEVATNLPLFHIPTEWARRKMLAHLNSGGGFGGWTPMFVVTKPIRK